MTVITTAQADVLILAPTAHDATVGKRMLEEAGFSSRVMRTVEDLCEALRDHTGVVMIAEEALHAAGTQQLQCLLDEQPSWSDLPIVLIAGENGLSRTIPATLADFATHANVMLLERPVRVATLVTTLRSALRARRRQIDLRNYLDERLASERALLDSEARERAARKEAQAANLAKSNFLAVMSHELRTPLNAIAGYAEILDLGIAGPMTEDQRRHIHRIMASERHLLALINDVLNFAKLEAGRIDLEITEVDLTKLLEGLDAFVGPQLHAKQLVFRTNLEPALTARGDEEKIRQILLNLLSNAIKFTPAAGTITLRSYGISETAVVEVRDTGPGVPANKLEAIFDPFVQLNRDYRTSAEGTGLGLSISRDLARRMHGELTVQSQVGGGSTFRLTLPRPATPA